MRNTVACFRERMDMRMRSRSGERAGSPPSPAPGKECLLPPHGSKPGASAGGDFGDKPVLQAKPSQNRLLWIGVSVIAILLFTIIFRLIRTRAGKMLQPPQKANEVLAVITNSGSTNAPGSTLTIMKDGSGSLTYQKGAQEERFSRFVNKTFTRGMFESNQLENMLTQIKDVGTIPNRDCLKSVSFGSTTTITYQGKTSGDLSCLSNEDPKIFLDLKKLVQSMLTHV